MKKDKIILFLLVLFYKFLSAFIKTKHKKNKKSILYFSAFFPENAGYHWRITNWVELLKKKGYSVQVDQAISKDDFYTLLNKNNTLLLIKILNKRFWQVVHSGKFETIIVRRELLIYNDYGNLFLDKLLLKMHPNAILDFDDDISATKKEPREISSIYGKLLSESGSKFQSSLSMYNYFFVGSHYLKNFVLNFNKKITADHIAIIPTCVDYEKHEIKKYNSNKELITFGWVGGNHNLNLLDIVIESLNIVAKDFKFNLLVISGKEYKNPNAKFNIINKQWSLDNEITLIKEIDIGLMPLHNTPIARGKSGFKLIQYMGMGVVSIASGITVNCDIVNDKINGFLVYKDNEWVQVIREVLTLQDNFMAIGSKARKNILSNYSFTGNFNKYLEIIKKTASSK